VRIVLVRHGDKEKGDFKNSGLGHNDQPLSALGLAQARILAEYLSGFRPESVFASRYVRTFQTLEPFAVPRGLPIKIEPRLDEVDIGLLDGMDDEDIIRLYPGFWKDHIEMDHDFRFPGGETGDEAMSRIGIFLDERAAEGSDCLCVSHDGLIRIALCRLLGLPSYKRPSFNADTCGVFELEYSAESARWKILRANQSPAKPAAFI
jgi:broad specificity phosphatase PhoE